MVGPRVLSLNVAMYAPVFQLSPYALTTVLRIWL